MATINHGAGADIIVPSSNGTTYRGLAGDDTYIISNSIAANAAITIVDTSGSNVIQLVDGLSITSSLFAADAVQLTLSNGAVVTINGASNFTYDVGGNTTSGVSGTSNTLTAFAASMGVATLPASGSTAGSSNVTVSGSAVSSSASPTYTLSKSATSVDEGSAVTFTVTSSSAVTADTSFSWTVIGSNNGSTVDKATSADLDSQSGTVTIASGSTSATFSVTAVSDSVAEGIEGIQVSVFDPDSATVGSSTILINNTGASASAQAFTGTTAVNTFTGASGDDSFSFTSGTLNDVDVIDGKGGNDTLTVTSAAATLTPNVENVENMLVTPTGTVVVNLVNTASTFSVLEAVSDAGENVTFNDIQAVPGAIKITNATGSHTFNFTAAAVAGTDTVAVILSGATTGADLTITDDSAVYTVEAVTIQSASAANTLTTMALDGATSLTITGDQSLTLTAALEATVVTVDASGMTGAVGLTMSASHGATLGASITGSPGVDSLTDGGAASIDTIDAGAGNDTITTSNYTALDAIDGGAGVDTVVLANTAVVSSTLGGLSNVEVLYFPTDNTSVTLTTNTGPAIFSFGTVDTTGTIAFNDAYDQASTVILTGDADSDDTITNNSGIALTVNANSADFADQITTITGHATATDVINITPTGAGDIGSSNAATITNIDTVNFIRPLAGVATATTMDFGIVSTAMTIDASALIVLDGALTLDLSAAATYGVITYTGGNNVNNFTGGTVGGTVTTGDAADTITLTSGANTVSSGGGIDTINMGTGADIIDAGAGNDIIVAGASDLLANDVIDGGDGTDTLTYAATSYADESVFGGLTNIEKIKPVTGINDANSALTMNGNIGPKIIDASDIGDLNLTLLAGYTDEITIDLGIGTDVDNKDEITNGGVLGANTKMNVNTMDADSIDAGTIITGGTGVDTINITNLAAGTATLSAATYIDVINVYDYTNGVDVTLTGGTNAATALTVNATTMDAGEILTANFAAATGSVTINAGAGADILTGGTVNDVISGGDGIDTIDAQEGTADSIDAGAGNDIITVSTAESEFSNSSTTALSTDTIDGGAGTDALVFGDAAGTLTQAELANISNIESLTLYTGSTITLSDAFLTNNPGISITLVAGTISAGTGTTANPTLTEALNYVGGNGNINVTGGTGDDTFSMANSAVFDISDTINGGAGTDTIKVYNDATFGVGAGAATGEAATLALDVYHTNIENVTVVDAAADDNVGDITITVALSYTGTALTVDASTLDQNALTTNQEILTFTQATTDLAAITLTSGAGNDIITTGAAADSVTTGAGIDTIVTSGGADIISAGAGNDIITAGAGRDNVDAGAGNDLIKITVDADFEVSGGTETIDGGAGTADVLEFSAAAEHIISAAELGSVSNIEYITTASGTGNNQATYGLSDTFLANNGGAITINGNTTTNAAADTKVDGSAVSTGDITFIAKGSTTAKNDTLIGGGGNDTFQVGYLAVPDTTVDEFEAGDTFTGNGGTDTLLLNNIGDGSSAARGTITATVDFDAVTGVERILVPDADGSTLGGADPITVTWSTGVTTANVPATFTVDASAITDVADNVDINWSSATAGDNDVLTTAFTITTGYGADSVAGSYGNDTINTSVGADSIFGGVGSDTIDGSLGNDAIYGGDETALTGVGDSLSGGAGTDIIDGDAGNDTIDGGDGADTITGGTGADIMTGGSGADTFLLPTPTESGGSNIDTITDFSTALGDVIRVTVTAAQIETAFGDVAATATTGNFAATDLGDVTTFAEAESILLGNMGEAVYVVDTAQLVIDFNGDGNINSQDIRINLTDTTSYTTAGVAYYLTVDADTARSYTTGSAADSVTGGGVVDTISTGAGNDTITGAAGADILSGGSGADNITGGAGVDVMTGGSGNDIIVATDGEADVVVFSGVTAAAPYAGTNNGKDTITFFPGTGETILRIYPLATVGGTGGTDGWLSLTGSGNLAVITSATGNAASTSFVHGFDNADATAPTVAEMAALFKTTVNTGNNTFALNDDAGAVIIHGDTAGANIVATVYWVDSTRDGDGTDVTATDVHILAVTSAAVDLDVIHTNQIDV